MNLVGFFMYICVMANQFKYKVYALKHPVTDEIRYIGYTAKTLEHRLKFHIYDCNKKITSHKVQWIRGLLNVGLKPKIELIEERDNIDDILKLEVYYISIFHNLTNSTTGGETNKVLCPLVRKKISEVLSDGRMKGSKNGAFGLKRPDLSERNKIVNKESVSKMSNTLKQMYNTPKYKLIL